MVVLIHAFAPRHRVNSARKFIHSVEFALFTDTSDLTMRLSCLMCTFAHFI